jgi:hypothetical protein
MFYGDPTDTSRLAFSGDVNNVVSAHRYKVFAPDQSLLDLIVNGLGQIRGRHAQAPPIRTSPGSNPQDAVQLSLHDAVQRTRQTITGRGRKSGRSSFSR